MKNKNITASMLYNLRYLFDIKGWEVDDSMDNENSLFNKFLEMFSWLKDEEQKFVFELTKKYFLKINFQDYPEILNLLLLKLQKNYPNLKKVYIAPLKGKDDMDKIKSSSLVSYLFKSVDISHTNYTFDIIVLDSEVSLQTHRSKINDNKNALLLIVDDYIGSGETAMSCLKYLLDNYNIKKERITVLSIAAQKDGIHSIEREGYKTLTYYKLNKGISDNYNGEYIHKYISIMESIEDRLDVNEKNKFGYKQSEALISLIRTPNNTFPIYWFNKRAHKFKAPFPRY